MSRIGKSIETDRSLVVARACGVEIGGVTANGYRVSFCDDGNIVELGSGEACTTLVLG